MLICIFSTLDNFCRRLGKQLDEIMFLMRGKVLGMCAVEVLFIRAEIGVNALGADKQHIL
jgi:hypothetical protein